MPSRPRFLENLAPRPDPVTTPHKHPSLSGDGSEMKGGEASAPHRHMDFGGSVGNQKEGRLFQPRFPISILHLKHRRLFVIYIYADLNAVKTLWRCTPVGEKLQANPCVLFTARKAKKEISAYVSSWQPAPPQTLINAATACHQAVLMRLEH